MVSTTTVTFGKNARLDLTNSPPVTAESGSSDQLTVASEDLVTLRSTQLGQLAQEYVSSLKSAYF